MTLPGWQYTDPLDVPCPWCRAATGERCRTKASGVAGEHHAQRHAAAELEAWANVEGEIGETLRRDARRRAKL